MEYPETSYATRLAAICLSILPSFAGATVEGGKSDVATAPLAPSQIAAAAPAGDWDDVAPENLLVMDLADGGRVVIELAPAFAPVHVGNIRALARAGWFDGAGINRVQDNYVVQWGGAAQHKPMPPGMAPEPPAEYDRPLAGSGFAAIPYRDSYADRVGHAGNWTAASDGRRTWLVHCYGSVGVGRDVNPDTGTGAELYAVIGQPPRHLDRNIAVAGRVLSGMEALSVLPRGTDAMGFHADPEQYVRIARIRLASEMPVGERPAFQVMRPGTASFAAWVRARANRQDEFFLRPAGAVDWTCNGFAPVTYLIMPPWLRTRVG